MSQTKIILISVFLSVALSTLITLTIVSILSNADVSQPLPETPVATPAEVTTTEEVVVVPEAAKSPLEVEFISLIERNQEIAAEMELYEFTDPKHAALLQELYELEKKIEENIVKRKTNPPVAQ